MTTEAVPPRTPTAAPLAAAAADALPARTEPPTRTPPVLQAGQVRPGRRPRLWQIAALALALGGGAYAAWGWLAGPKLATVAVAQGALVQSIVASGRVESPHRVNIGSQITGTVLEVPVAEGQDVAAGQILVVLADAELAAGLAQAEAAVAQAEARLRQIAQVGFPVASETRLQAEANLLNAERAFTRSAELRASGAETQARLDETRRALDVATALARSARVQEAGLAQGGIERVLAETALRQAEASRAVARSRLDYTQIRAPLAGSLIARTVEPGWVVQANQVLMVLSPHGALQLVVQIDERNLGRLALGQAAIASADAYPAQRFEARVAYINPAVDAQRAAVEVKLSVPDPPAYLRQDMTVSVDVAVAAKDRALVLPIAAIHEPRGAAPFVLRVEAGRAVRVPVRLGLVGGSLAEIADGLKEGDAVLPASAPVAAGARVRVATP
jgi:HlyD family secretion protein